MHIDEDRLLQYALGALPDQAVTIGVEQHLACCAECRSRLNEIKGDVDVIGSIRPNITPLGIPRQYSRPALWARMLRVAAVFAFGITIGFGTSNWLREESTCISPAYVEMSPAASSVYGFAATDATEVPPCEYSRILHSQ